MTSKDINSNSIMICNLVWTHVSLVFLKMVFWLALESGPEQACALHLGPASPQDNLSATIVPLSFLT